MLSVFYYLRPQDYVGRFGDVMRNLTYEQPYPASIPEALHSYRAYYEAHPPSRVKWRSERPRRPGTGAPRSIR